MACLEHNGKKYTKGQFKKEILKSPEDFAMHVLDDEDVKHFALDEAPATDKKMSEFDELLDAKKGIDTIEIPAEIQKQLEDAATNLTPEETEALDGFGSALESARNAGGAEDKGPAENSAPEDNGTDGGKTIEPVAEDAQGEKSKDKSGGLRKGAVSKGEGDKSAKGVKLEQSEVKPGTTEVNGYKITMESEDMPDGEPGMKVSIEKPDGTKVDTGKHYIEDVAGEVNKKLRGFDLAKTVKKGVAEPKDNSADIGKRVKYEAPHDFSGNLTEGTITGIDAKGNYKIKSSKGEEHAVSPNSDTLQFQSEEPLKDGTTTVIKAADSPHTVEVKIKKKAKEANAKAEEKGITLSEQKADLVGKMEQAEEILTGKTRPELNQLEETHGKENFNKYIRQTLYGEITPEITTSLEKAGITVTGTKAKNIAEIEQRLSDARKAVRDAKGAKNLNSANFDVEHLTKELEQTKKESVPQLKFQIKGDGEVSTSVDAFSMTLEMTKKEFPEGEYKVKEKKYGGPGKAEPYELAPGKGPAEALDSAKENLETAKKGGNKKMIETAENAVKYAQDEFDKYKGEGREKETWPEIHKADLQKDLEQAKEDLKRYEEYASEKEGKNSSYWVEEIRKQKDKIKSLDEQIARFQKSSTSEPITRAKLTQAIARIKKLFPNIEITNDSREWNEALSKARPEEMKQTPNGFIYKGKMYLNPDIDMIKGDTVAHETQHIANEVMKAKAPEKWEQGVKLALQGGAIEKLRESYPHLMSDEAIADEFIADAVGKRVEQLDEELKQKGIPERIINQITDWVEQAKDWIYDKLGYTPDMTFGEFVDKAAKLQVRGKEIGGIDELTGKHRFQFDEKLTDEEKKHIAEQAKKRKESITDEEAQKMAFGKVPTDDKTIDTSMAPEAKAETIPGSTTSTYHAETRKDLIGALKEAGLWDKKNVSTFDKDGNVLKVGEKRKPADEQKSIDTLRGAINDLIKKIDPKLHTEDGRDNKKSFQLDLENLRDELSDKKTIPVLKEILKDLSGEQKLLDIPKEDLTKAQRKAQKFYTDVMQLKKQAAYIEETNGSVITSETSHIPKGTVVEQSTKEFNGRFPGFEKYKDAPILKNVIPYIEKYVRATSGVRGFGKWLTGKSDGLINAATKALSQAPGKAFRIKETAEKLTKPLFDKNGYETRSTYESKEGFEKTKPVDINTVAKGIAPEGTVVSPKELNDIYLTLRQPEVNRTYFSNERDAARLEKDIAPKEKELADLKAKDQAQLDQREKNAIDESIENLSEEIEKTRGEIEDLKKNVQGFTLQAIDGVRPETTFKISSEHFGKIRDYARGEFGEQVSGWEQATKFIHPFLNQAFKMENGVALAEHEKFYPLTHGKPNEVRSYTKQQKFIDDFRSAKYRNPAIEGNNYLVISSDIKMQSYINSAAKYSAYSTPIRNMDAVMNGLEGTVSKDDQEWWNKQKAHAEDPNRFSGLIGEMGEFEKKLYAGFSTSVLGLNPFIPPKEIGAVFLGTSEIDSKYLLPQVPKLVGGLGKLLKSFNPMALRTYDATEQEMMQHNDMANMRLQSGVTDYAELSNEMGKVKIPGTEKEVDLSKATEPMLMAHRMVQKAYWTAAKAKIDAEQPELKGDAYWKAVGDIYEKVTLATQPSIDTFNSPSFRKETNPLTRVLSIYAGQSFVNMNNLMGKTLEYMHDPSNANAKLAVAKSATNIFIVNALMLTAIDALRPGGKKDDKNEITLDALKNVSKSIPIFSPIIDAIINKYKSPAFGYGLELPIMEIGNEMTSGLASVAHGKFDRGIDDMIKAAAAYKGVPIMPYEEAKRVLR